MATSEINNSYSLVAASHEIDSDMIKGTRIWTVPISEGCCKATLLSWSFALVVSRGKNMNF